MSLSRSVSVGTQPGTRAGLEVQVERALDGLDDRLGHRGAVLDQHPGADRAARARPASTRWPSISRTGAGGASVAAIRSPRDTSRSLASRSITDWPATGHLQRAVRSVDARDRGVRAARQHHDLVADPDPAGVDLAGVAAVVAVELGRAGGPGGGRGGLRPHHVLHREAELRAGASGRGVDGLQVPSTVGPSYQASRSSGSPRCRPRSPRPGCSGCPGRRGCGPAGRSRWRSSAKTSSA